MLNYKAKTVCKKGFVVKSEVDGTTYKMDKDKEQGTTPVGVLTAALSGCVIMCTRGYYTRVKEIENVKIEVDTTLEDFKFTVDIHVDRKVTAEDKKGIIENIKDKCTVSKMLARKVKIKITITGKEK